MNKVNNKVYIETLGCPKNFNDSEVASAILEKASYEIVDEPTLADIIIVNTCGFINDAKKESIDKIFEMASFNKKLVVSGCLSERYHKELMEEMPEVDLFIGVNEYKKLPELLDGLNQRCDGVSHITCEDLSLEDRRILPGVYSSTLKISEGCNNNCSYCVIPSIRGKYRSKKMEDCISEAKYLASIGVKELVIIAQDITTYGIDLYKEYKLADLLREICKIDGIKWVRLMYSYEDRITDDLIKVIKEEPKICKYIDIPIQHSSDNVLKGMLRRSTNSSIKDTIKKLRDAVPNIAIRTTLIVGFPGEEEEDFENLLAFIQDTKFARLGAFKYSKEEGTLAGDMPNQVDEDIKDYRLNEVMELQRRISLENNESFKGKVLEVLVEGEDSDGSYYGRTEFDAPEIDNSVLFTSKRKLKTGEFVKIKITDAYDYDLIGEEI